MPSIMDRQMRCKTTFEQDNSLLLVSFPQKLRGCRGTTHKRLRIDDRDLNVVLHIHAITSDSLPQGPDEAKRSRDKGGQGFGCPVHMMYNIIVSSSECQI